MKLPFRQRRKRRGGISTFAAGLIGAALIIVFSYLAYTKFANPFASKFTVTAVFPNAAQLRPASLVRIAGVNVGSVNSVQPLPGCRSTASTPAACSAAAVTMTIGTNGLPLHSDATFAIRPRTFLEGNFFVDISPGTPEAPVVTNGHTFPITQGTQPVQFDQILTSLQADTRQNLQTLLKAYGGAVKESSTSFNKSIRFWLPAYEYTAIVAHDALGIEPHDLSNAIYQFGTVAGAASAHPQNLENLITDFNTTANAFARQNVALENAVAELPRTLTAAMPAFDALNAAFPPLHALARTLIPGVKSLGPTIDVSLPFITQLRLLVRPSELRGLTSDLAVTVPKLANLTVNTIPLMENQVRPASSCIANVVYPWSQLTLNDPNFNAKNGYPPHKAYVEAVDYLPGLAGESRDFDANGPYIRVLGALGDTVTYTLTSTLNKLIGGSLVPIVAVQPQLPPGDKAPPLEPNVPCETQQAITDLSAPSAAGPQPIPAVLPPPSQVAQKRAAANTLSAISHESPKQQAKSWQELFTASRTMANAIRAKARRK